MKIQLLHNAVVLPAKLTIKYNQKGTEYQPISHWNHKYYNRRIDKPANYVVTKQSVGPQSSGTADVCENSESA